jgi:hypothetical protein
MARSEIYPSSGLPKNPFLPFFLKIFLLWLCQKLQPFGASLPVFGFVRQAVLKRVGVSGFREILHHEKQNMI